MADSDFTDLDGLRATLRSLPGPDEEAERQAAAREPTLTKPAGALGRLEQLSQWAACWQGRHPATADKVRVVVFAGNHGVVAQGVSAFPAEVTAQMVANFEAGGAAINQISEAMGLELRVFDAAVATPTADFSQQPAMTDARCVEAFRLGMSAVEPSVDIICLGEMGIGNTTSAAAICHALFGGDSGDWTGPGTGIAGDALTHKAEVVAHSVKLHQDIMSDGIDVMRCVGGAELAAIAGAIIAARQLRIPVVLDGFTCTAAAATLEKTVSGSLDHCVIGHLSAEPGHRRLLDALDSQPLLQLGMRLGEGTGAALAIGVLRGALASHAGMATFADAGVSDRD